MRFSLFGFESRMLAIASVALLIRCFYALAEGSAALDEYEFVRDTDRWVMVIQGEIESIGKLDEAGNFIQDENLHHFKRGQHLSNVPPCTLINGSVEKGQYEYRSGRLILGDLDKQGNFIPTVGAKIIDFKDYVYSPKGPQIYNLPGKFVRKGAKEEKK